MSPSSAPSSTPVIVTVCGLLQFPEVKLRLAGLTVPSPVSELDRPSETLAVGWLRSVTVKVAVPPASVVTSPEVWLKANPTTSLSSLVTETSGGFTPP